MEILNEIRFVLNVNYQGYPTGTCPGKRRIVQGVKGDTSEIKSFIVIIGVESGKNIKWPFFPAKVPKDIVSIKIFNVAPLSVRRDDPGVAIMVREIINIEAH